MPAKKREYSKSGINPDPVCGYCGQQHRKVGKLWPCKPTKEKVAEITRKVAESKHMSKPDAENAVVVRDAGGRWICEIYTAGHKIK